MIDQETSGQYKFDLIDPAPEADNGRGIRKHRIRITTETEITASCCLIMHNSFCALNFTMSACPFRGLLSFLTRDHF